ncbi:MAG: hypothetical protein V3R87_09285 [Dehalococcoidia bacterium]
MSATGELVADDVDGYRLLLKLWHREIVVARLEFLGLLSATVILALVSLSGNWWPPLFGFAVSVVWLAAAARSLRLQDHLYGKMEAASGGQGDNPAFQLHHFAQAESPSPAGKAPAWVRFASRQVFLGAPAVLIVAWFAGFIVSLAT